MTIEYGIYVCYFDYGRQEDDPDLAWDRCSHPVKYVLSKSDAEEWVKENGPLALYSHIKPGQEKNPR